MEKTCAKDDESKQKHHGLLAKLYKNSSLAAHQLNRTMVANAIATENASKEYYLQGKVKIRLSRLVYQIYYEITKSVIHSL